MIGQSLVGGRGLANNLTFGTARGETTNPKMKNLFDCLFFFFFFKSPVALQLGCPWLNIYFYYTFFNCFFFFILMLIFTFLKVQASEYKSSKGECSMTKSFFSSFFFIEI